MSGGDLSGGARNGGALSCLRVALLLVLLAGAAAAAPPSGDVILLVGGNSFAAGDRVARLLDEATAASGVLGPASFEIVAAPLGAPGDVPPLVAERLARGPAVRAVVALLGDLTALRGVDPSIKAFETGALSSRTPRVPEVIAERDALAAAAAQAGASFLAATAPLGRPARVEVPELLVVADALRAAGPVLDLQASFQSLEDGPLFENSLDRLDDWGHDALARALLPALLEALPPRDAEERSARLVDRALQAFAQDRAEEFSALQPQLEASAPRGARVATRRAALLSAVQGLQARAADWDAIDPGAEPDVPGLLLARLLMARPHGSLAPADESEMSLATIAASVADSRTEISGLALQAVNSLPERVEAWLMLQLACDTVGPRRDWRETARHTLQLFDRGTIAESLSIRLLDAWPASRDALPAVVCARRAWSTTLPDGPVLREARRRGAVGYVEVAANMLEEAAAGVSQRLPPRWHEQIAAWQSESMSPGR